MYWKVHLLSIINSYDSSSSITQRRERDRYICKEKDGRRDRDMIHSDEYKVKTK